MNIPSGNTTTRYKAYIKEWQDWVARQPYDPEYQAYMQALDNQPLDYRGQHIPYEGKTYSFADWMATQPAEVRADYEAAYKDVQAQNAKSPTKKIASTLKVAIPALVGGAGLAATGAFGAAAQAAVGGAPLGGAAGVGGGVTASQTGLGLGTAEAAGALGGAAGASGGGLSLAQAGGAVGGGSSITGALTSALTGQLGKSLLPVVGAALGGAAVGSAASGGGSGASADPSVSSAISTNQGLAAEQAAFTRDQWAEQMAYLAKIDPAFGEYMKSNLGNLGAIDKQNAEQFSDYSTLYRPVQQAYIDDVMRAGSQTAQGEAAATAGAGVQKQIDMQREIDARAMASMGVSPESGRYGDRTSMVLGAAARAGAENAARMSERDRGTTLKAQATGLGLNLANTAQQGVQVSNQTAGTGASVAQVPFNLKQSADAQHQAGLGSAAAINTSAGQLGLGSSQLSQAGWIAKQGVTNQNLSGLGSLGAFLYNAFS